MVGFDGMSTKIVTWNVNSVKARQDRLLAFLEREKPDVLCLQELKVVDENFPLEEVRAQGYEAAIFGQKTYNGVAILSRCSLGAPRDVQRGMPDVEEDTQARYIAATVGAMRVICVYVPNGSTPGSDKFKYKLTWLERLQAILREEITQYAAVVLCGDFNIAPEDRDVARKEQWDDSVLCVAEVRDHFRSLLDLGLVDVFRSVQPDTGHYSWWDYRMLGFPKNNGLRIDHILASATIARNCKEARVDREERKGSRPSDHAPVICTFSDP